MPRRPTATSNTATLDTIDAVQERMAPDTIPLTVGRVVNAGLGLIGAPLALLVTLGAAWRTWRREGDDPELTDSPSILMAGPPAEMTPPLATVVRAGRATQHSTNTLLAELAGTGRLAFHNLDQVRGMKSDDEPDPLTDPAIEVRRDVGGDDELTKPEREAWDRIRKAERRVRRAQPRTAVAAEFGPRRRQGHARGGGDCASAGSASCRRRRSVA